MNILIVTPSLYDRYGGIEDQVAKEIKELESRGHCIKILIIESYFDFKETVDLKNGIKTNLLHYYMGNRKVLELLSERYDLVHAHDPRLLFGARLHNIPFAKKIISTQGLIFHTKKFYIFKRIYCQLMLCAFYSKYDGAIAISDNDKKYVSKNIKKTEVIYPGVSFKIDNKISITRNFSNKRYNILCHGRIAKNKRIELAVDRIREVRCQHKIDIFLTISGGVADNSIYEKLERLTKVHEWIKLIPNVDEDIYVDLLNANNFFITASEYEGFGIAPLEASAAGLICILNSYATASEVFTNERNAFIIDFDSDDATIKIASALSRTSQFYSRLSLCAAKNAENFSDSKSIRLLANFVENVIND